MPAIGKFVVIACSACLVALLIANVVHSVPASQAALSADSHTDEAIHNFFAYHGTNAKSRKGEHHDHGPDCQPCAAKAAALKAGGVPAKPPPEKVDQPYQRITGRLPTYEPPTHQGTIDLPPIF